MGAVHIQTNICLWMLDVMNSGNRKILTANGMIFFFRKTAGYARTYIKGMLIFLGNLMQYYFRLS